MTIAKIVELSSESPDGFEAAAKTGIERARKTLDGVRSAWVKDQQIEVDSSGRTQYRVTMKVTFVMKE